MDFAGSIKTSIFAYVVMAVVSMLVAVMVRGIVILLQRTGTKTAAPIAVSISVAPALDQTAAHVAAVAAAVYAVLGGQRLVRIGDAQRSPAWISTGRTIHQTSHAPRRTPR